jgi:hypothetical protein
MRTKLREILLLCMIVSLSLVAGCQQKDVPLSKLTAHAVALSQLTFPGSKPFHLRAEIVESTNPDSDYKANVEEYWLSPTKWRRTIQSPHFSQTLIVNGDGVSEQDTGDYYPFWLRDLVTAILEPLPMAGDLEQTHMNVPSPYIYGCARFQQQTGLSPAHISEFSVFCFQGRHELLESVVTPGYDADFKDYERFKDKFVARRIITDPEPGTTIEATITKLEPLSTPNENLFAIQQTTPPQDRVASVRVDQALLRNNPVTAPDIVWPSVRDGRTSGVTSMYVSVDRDGHVRETWPLNSDNARVDDSARTQVMKWRFKPVTKNGVPVQVESIFTFAFNTETANAIPILTNTQARTLATVISDANIRPGSAKAGTPFTVRITVAADGKLEGIQNVNDLPDVFFLPACSAIEKWRFKPYLHDGKPDEFKADITFHVR